MFVIGTAGHVDHGKSLLVEALTGIDPDRLAEEKARGMTIDLGFAWLTLPSGRTVSIVDVPGHERFIKNMLAGAGGIDVALFVVAADDGVMPQTREHLAILDLLGVSRGVVALTKRDLVDDDWLALAEADAAELLRGTTLDGSPIVACSAVLKTGLDELLSVLDDAIDALPPKRNTGRPRLPIDRVFTIGGFGTVVTGTLIDGELAAGDEVEVVPGGLRARVRGLQSHRDAVGGAMPGTRTAANLSGVAKDDLRRGMVLTRPGALRPTLTLDARVRAVTRNNGVLRHNARVTFHCLADEAGARLRLLDADELRGGDEAWAQVKLNAPVAVMRGDRFILRTPNETVAGGEIVDTAPKRHRRRDAATIGALEALLSASPEDVVLEAIGRQPVIERAALQREASLPAATVDTTVDALVRGGSVMAFGAGADALLAMAARARHIEQRAREALTAYHARHPLRAGMPQEELRSRLRLDVRDFAALRGSWTDVVQRGASVALASFQAAPSSTEQERIDVYLSALRASPYHPSSDSAIEPELLAYAVDSGTVVDAGDGVVFDARAFAEMESRVRERIRREGGITLAQARDLFQTSRRHAQALLEELDRRRVTRRAGDERVLR